MTYICLQKIFGINGNNYSILCQPVWINCELSIIYCNVIFPEMRQRSTIIHSRSIMPFSSDICHIISSNREIIIFLIREKMMQVTIYLLPIFQKVKWLKVSALGDHCICLSMCSQVLLLLSIIHFWNGYKKVR